MVLHNATIDKEVTQGDAKISGSGRLVHDDAEWDRDLTAPKAEHTSVPDGRFPVFRVDVHEASMVRPAGDHLLIESWREGEPVRRIERR